MKSQPFASSLRTSQILAQKVASKPVVLNLPKAHADQYRFISLLDKHPYLRFVVGAAGTKWGKTTGTSIALVKQAWENRDSRNWWVAPTYSQSENAYSLISRLLPAGTYKEYKASLTLELIDPAGKEYSLIEFKSGEKPGNLRGFGVNFFIIDEAALVPYESFVSVMTTVTQTFGKGYIISTPAGRNWFYDVYQRGEKFFTDGTPKYENPEDDPWREWISIRMPTWANPHVPKKSVEQLRKNLPEDVFQQEVAAEFLLDSAGVFKGINDCVRGVLQPPVPGHRYVMGVDLARLKDFSVLTVIDTANNNVVYWERFNQIRWEIQYHRIIETARKYNNATAVIDSTGLGDPVVEQIQSGGVRVVPYKISGPTAKKQLIDKLRVNIEQKKISFPHIPQLRRELEAYEYQISDNGVFKYSAPSGEKDDCVISLALANWVSDQAPWVYKYTQHRGV
jgi:hypothetical protein